jgi:hypothetical protein
MNIETLLHEEIGKEFEKLNTMKEGTEEYKTTVDGLTKLMDRAIEINKIDAERLERKNQTIIENSLKAQQAKDDKIDKIVRNVISVAGIVIPSVITIWGTVKSIKFEETGTITTIMGRGFINKLLPKK